nr:MAG TPA: hypothetical protein [Caudoviricetes sp.]
MNIASKPGLSAGFLLPAVRRVDLTEPRGPRSIPSVPGDWRYGTRQSTLSRSYNHDPRKRPGPVSAGCSERL